MHNQLLSPDYRSGPENGSRTRVAKKQGIIYEVKTKRKKCYANASSDGFNIAVQAAGRAGASFNVVMKGG